MINRKIITTILVIMLFLIAVFYPTSISSVIFDSNHIVIYYFIVLLVLITLFLVNKKNMVSISISVILIILLTMSTLASIYILDAELSIARIAPVLLSLLVFSIRFPGKSDYFKMYRLILEFVTLSVIIVNFFTILNVPFAVSFLINNYSQFNFFTVSSSLGSGKPIFTFGVHSFASLFYMLIFIMWFVTINYQKKPKFRFFIYLFLLIIFTILLNSVTSIVFASVMVTLLFMSIKQQNNRILSILIALAFVVILIPRVYSPLFELFVNTSHGFIPRYFSNNIFTVNFEIIQKTIIGIGFTIPRSYNIVYTDSGYLVYMTMGTVYMPIILYLLFWKFLRINLKEYYILLFTVIMVFELALPSLIYLRTVLFLVFSVEYINSCRYKFTNNGG